jgi:protein subunit release factor B
MAADEEQGGALEARLRALGVSEDDLDESFVRSSGKGGQNVNKVATCVVLVHRPSGVAVKCQRARTQAQNRTLAREMLADKLEAARAAAAAARQQAAARLSRQRRRRPRRAKENILAAKHARAETKRGRRSVSRDHD